MIKIICDGCGREIKNISHLTPGIGPYGIKFYIAVETGESGALTCDHAENEGQVINVCSPKCRLELHKRYPEIGRANSPLREQENELGKN